MWQLVVEKVGAKGQVVAFSTHVVRVLHQNVANTQFCWQNVKFYKNSHPVVAKIYILAGK